MKVRLGTEAIKGGKPKAWAYLDGVMIIGFESNLIVKVHLDGKQREVLVAGHAQAPTYLTTHKKLKVIASIGSDKFLRLYSYQAILEKRNPFINSLELQHVPKSLDFSPDGRYLAIGYDQGIFEVFQVFDNNGDYFQFDCMKMFDLNRKFPV